MMEDNNARRRKLQEQLDKINRTRTAANDSAKEAPEGEVLRSLKNGTAEATKHLFGFINRGSKLGQTLIEAFNTAAKFYTAVKPYTVDPLWKATKWAYFKMSHRKEPDGTLKWDVKKSLKAAFTLAVLGFGAVTYGPELVWDGAGIIAFSGVDNVYIQKIVPVPEHKGVYEVWACETNPCESQGAFAYRVRDSYALDLITAMQKIGEGRPLEALNGFLPDAVGGQLNAVGGKCDVAYWGWRQRAIRQNPWFDMFPTVKSITNCEQFLSVDTIPSAALQTPVYNVPAATVQASFQQPAAAVLQPAMA
ncbi:MAG TPA: hypothetical protein VIN59_01765 [Alphaproteobacteria bacterium]